MFNLETYGLRGRFAEQASFYPDLSPARVISQHRELYKVVTQKGESLAEVSGKFRHQAWDASDFPVVGDFVMLDDSHGTDSNAIIHTVLPRKSAFERVAAGKGSQPQVIASNIDIIFICMSLNNDYNLSRLERFLSAAWDSWARPVVVLTKSDLCDNLQAVLDEVAEVAVDTEIVATTSEDEASCNRLLEFLRDGQTASFIGSSGVGKSTLINRMAGSELLATSGIRRDDKGRHTTTSRELLVLPCGGIVIDTPGMREFAVESVDLSRTFGDIEELIQQCRFNDCSHRNEPGCAIREAIETGELDKRRFENYLKLQKEAHYASLTSRQRDQEKLLDMANHVGGMKKLNRMKRYIKKQMKYKL